MARSIHVKYTSTVLSLSNTCLLLLLDTMNSGFLSPNNHWYCTAERKHTVNELGEKRDPVQGIAF